MSGTLLARAVFVLDTDNTIRYVEYVDNINSEPNFEAAIAATKAYRKSSVTKSSSCSLKRRIFVYSKYKFKLLKNNYLTLQISRLLTYQLFSDDDWQRNQAGSK